MEMYKFDLTKEYGVVLEGGGAKGAYQIGVWAAMQECGVKIRGIAGVSVGALNGALIAMGDILRAVEIWENLTYSKVMDVDDEQMDTLFHGKIRNMNFKELVRLWTKFMVDKGFDITPLRTLIDEAVDEEKIRNSPIELVLGTFSMDELKQLEITAAQTQEGELKDYLLASAYFPAFRNEPLHGKKYMDGGVINNLPIDMLIKRGYKDILVVRIFGLGIIKNVKLPDEVTVIEIAPRTDLGNILDFNSENSRKNMRLGYFDGLRCFRSLKGKMYYINSKLGEEESIFRLVGCHNAVQMALLEYFGESCDDPNIYTRKLFEKVFPSLAGELKLDKNWTYHELYLSLLELCAKNLRIQKYQIYTEEELKDTIQKRYTIWKRNHSDLPFPPLIELILKMVTLPQIENNFT